MEKNTLIAVISIGFVSITALVLSIIGVSGNHECMGERGMRPGMMMEMGQGGMKGQKDFQMRHLSGTNTEAVAPIN